MGWCSTRSHPGAGTVSGRVLHAVTGEPVADVEVVLYALAADGVSSAGYGMLDRHTRHYCTRLVPAEGASMRLGNEPGQELLVGITTTRPGRSVIRGHRIEFSEGWRRGSADIQVSVVVKAR